jgi:hypothetical protein
MISLIASKRFSKFNKINPEDGVLGVLHQQTM